MLRRGDARRTIVTALAAVLMAPGTAHAQDMGGVVGLNNVTNAICGGSCDSVASRTRREDAALRAAIASVPVSRRPLGFVMRTVLISNGATLAQSLVPWVLFPNGTAANCYGWDPRRTAPSPASLHAHAKDCEVASWRRTADGIVLTDADGEVSEPYAMADIRRFAPGQRFTQRLRSYGPSIATPSGLTPSSSIINISEVSLTSAGTIQTGNIRRIWEGGNSTSRTQRDVGRYYLDGYLAAVQHPDGRIEIVITGHLLSTTNTPDFGLIVWNGVLFSRD